MLRMSAAKSVPVPSQVVPSGAKWCQVVPSERQVVPSVSQVSANHARWRQVSAKWCKVRLLVLHGAVIREVGAMIL